MEISLETESWLDSSNVGAKLCEGELDGDRSEITKCHYSVHSPTAMANTSAAKKMREQTNRLPLY